MHAKTPENEELEALVGTDRDPEAKGGQSIVLPDPDTPADSDPEISASRRPSGSADDTSEGAPSYPPSGSTDNTSDRPASHPLSSPTTIPVNETNIDPEVLSCLEDMVKQLSNALKLRSFYPKGHSAVAPALAQFKTLLDAALGDMGEITIGSTGERLLFEGQLFGEGKRPLLNFAKHLKVRNVSGITFRKGVTDTEIENILEILSSDPENVAPPESPLKDLESAQENVDIRRVNYGNILRHVSGEQGDLSTSDNPQDMWRSLVTHHLLSDGDELSNDAREIIAKSAGDRIALEQMTRELVRASSDSGRDAAGVARGLAMTCKGMQGMADTKRSQGVSNLAAIVAEMDPKVLAHLAEIETTDSEPEHDPVQEMIEKLPVRAKLRLLTALVHSQRMDKSRLSSVFRRVAGARSKRQELLEEMRQEVGEASPDEAPHFDRVYTAVQNLVLTESEGRFVGDDYVSMLEELGEVTLDPEETTLGSSGNLEEFRRTLDHDQRVELKARFLLDLSRLQEDQVELARTLDEIKRTCGELCVTGDPEVLTEIIVDLADDLSKSPTPDTEGAAQFQDCLRTLAARDCGRPALERLIHLGAESQGALEALLAACGSEACPNVWSVVARSDAAAENPRLMSYVAGHSATACEASKEYLQTGPLQKTKRVLRALEHLGTPEAVQVMEWALENGEQGAQREIIRALASMRAPAAQKALRGLLAGGDQRLMILVADSLGAARSQQAIPMLLESLKSLDFFGRRLTEAKQVAAALGKIGSQSAVPCLERLLTRRLCAPADAKRDLRRTVALALRNIGGDEANLVLQRNSSCYNRQVREACAWALSRPERSRRETEQDWDSVWSKDITERTEFSANHDETVTSPGVGVEPVAPDQRGTETRTKSGEFGSGGPPDPDVSDNGEEDALP